MLDKQKFYACSEEEPYLSDQLEGWNEVSSLRQESGDEENNMENFPGESYASPPAQRPRVLAVAPPPPRRKPCYGHAKSVWPDHECRPAGSAYTRDQLRLWKAEGVFDVDGKFVPMSTPGRLKRVSPLVPFDENAQTKMPRLDQLFLC